MTDDKPKTRSRAWRWWLAGGAVAVAVALVAGACWFWLVGRKVWTDDDSILVADSDAAVRQVLWTSPAAMGGQFNTPAHEYEPAVSPDQLALYFVRGLPGQGADIYVSRRGVGGWGEPVPLAGVNTPDFDELGPRLTPDGSYLLFYSDRPGGLGMYDIWAAQREGDGWGEPFNLGASVNTRWNEYSPTVALDGRLYFATNRIAAEQRKEKQDWRATIRQTDIGDYDLFMADGLPEKSGAVSKSEIRNPRFEIPDPKSEIQNLKSEIRNPTFEIPDPKSEIELAAPSTQPTTATAPSPRLAFAPAVELVGVNTPAHEGACCVTPGGDFLYFASNRAGGLGGFDLYRARLRDGRVWGVENLGPQINTPENETDPQLAMGGFQMVFSSDRPASAGGYDLYTALTREVYAMRARRPPPALGWHVWALLGALAVAIPLLLFLKAGGYKHLDLLQKCVFVSLLIHALLIGAFNFLILSRQIIAHVAREAGLTVAVNLDVAREVEMRTQVREQVTDMPAAEVKTADLAKIEITELPRSAPPPMPINPPKVEVMPAQASVAAKMPVYFPERPAEKLDLPPPPNPADQPQIDLTAAAPLKTEPVEPEPITPQPVRAEARKLTVPPPRPRVPADRPPDPSAPEMTSLAQAVAETLGRTEIEQVRPPAGVVPPIELLVADPTPPQAVASRTPDLPTPAETLAQTERADAEVASPQARAVVKIAPERTEIRTDSLARQVAPDAPRPQPVETVRPPAEIVPAPEVAAADPQVDQAVATDQPKMPDAPEAVAPISRARTEAPLDAQPVELAIAPAPSETRTDSLAKRTEAAPKSPAPAESLRPAVELPQHIDLLDAGSPDVTVPRLTTTRPAGPEADAPAAKSDRIEIGSAGAPTARAELQASAAPRAALKAESLASVAEPARAAKAPEAPAAAVLVPMPTAPELAMTETTAPKAAGRGAPAEVPEADAAVATAPRAEAPSRVNRPPIAGASVAPARGQVSADSLARRQVTTRPSVDIPRRMVYPRPRLVEAIGVEPAGPVTPAARIVSASLEGMVVSDAPARSEPVRTASPQGRAELTGPAIPTAKPIRQASMVQASINDRPPTTAAHIAVDVPTRVQAEELTLPVLAVATQEATRQPLIATGVEPLQPVERRPLSSIQPERPSELLTQTTIQATTRAAAESLANQPLARTPRPRAADVVGDQVALAAPMLRLEGSLEPGKLTSPESFEQRSFEQRLRLVQEMGGSEESEASVSKALVYLARNQQSDGRWTYYTAGAAPDNGRTQEPDMALTGLSALSFMAADHTPDKDGPYRQTLTKAMDYLMSQQKPDGDLRGRGRMYCQAIATLALAEAALMTGDDRYRKAAVKGAEFIIKAQNPSTGGWRYAPGDPGDTSVFGWQVMALKSVENLGYKIPDKTRAGAFRWLDSVASGKQGMLAGYTGRSPTPAMTAEAVFSRMLLGAKLTDPQVNEVTDYLLKYPPGSGQHDVYCWYYASLALMQLQGEPWERWNDKMRDFVLKLQNTKGEAAGSWEPGKDRYGQRGNAGRVYVTAMSALTLEVYYRYLPLYGREIGAEKK